MQTYKGKWGDKENPRMESPIMGDARYNTERAFLVHMAKGDWLGLVGELLAERVGE